MGDGGAIAPDSVAGADEPGPAAGGAAGEGVAGCVAGAAGRMVTGPVDSGIVSGPL